MEQSKEIEKLFVGRFIDLWMCFNPGKFTSADIRNVGIRYYKILSAEGIDFKTFDLICNSVERDFSSLGYDFNLAAYVMDCVRSERVEKEQERLRVFSEPVELPATSTQLFSENPRMAESIKILEKRGVNSFSKVIQKLNTLRQCGKFLNYNYRCFACMDTGFVAYSVLMTDDKKKFVKIREESDSGCVQVTKRCMCHEGSILAACIPQATKQECIEAAKIHGGSMEVITANNTYKSGNVDRDSEAPF